MKAMRAVVVAVLCWSSTGTNLRAWDYEVHRAIVDLALGALPTNFPAFVRCPRTSLRSSSSRPHANVCNSSRANRIAGATRPGR